jgi:hypothetical protein
MLLLIVIVILIWSAGILWNIYFSFFSFQQNYLDLNNYYNSNYGAVSSIERALISSKYTWPWFVWSGWFLSTWNWWSISDIFSWDFGKFTNDINWIYRSLNSKTQKIEGKLNYNEILNIILSTNSWDNLYSWTNTYYNFFDESIELSWYINILNFEEIEPSTWIQLKRIIRTSNNGEYIIAGGEWNEILNEKINNNSTIFFASGIYDIFNSWSILWSGFLTSWISYAWNINDALSWWCATWLNLYITWWYLINSNWAIPYLFYSFESNTDFSDIYYYITWTSIVWNYQKDIFIKKPTSLYHNQQNFIFPYYE